MAEEDTNGDQYENESVAKLFENADVTSILEQDRRRCEDEDLDVMWYHAKLSRDDAGKILKEASQQSDNGLFLVRDSSSSEQKFALSFIHDSVYYNYCIDVVGLHYKTERGPAINGLDKLIEHYIQHADGLPTCLTHFCRGSVPPPKTRKSGPTNILHKAVKERREKIVCTILNHALCPDVDAKNELGSTALHDACCFGLDGIVTLLINKGADVMARDMDGNTPLHKACAANHANICSQLIKKDYLCLQEKAVTNGMVPLHIAAIHGHLKAIHVLLKEQAALFPQDNSQLTPVEYAEQYRRNDCISVLDTVIQQSPCTSQDDWFHQGLDRKGAERIFSQVAATNGLFLIRPGKAKGESILTLFKDKSLLHYVVGAKEYRGHWVYSIDQGPYMSSLEALIFYYHRFLDGFPVELKASISKDMTVKTLDFHSYRKFSVSEFSAAAIKPASPPAKQTKPKLPPRPNDPDSICSKSLQALSSSSPTTPEPQTQAPKPQAQAPKQPACPMEQEKPLTTINIKNLKRGNVIGQGEYGSVLKGLLTIPDKKKIFGRKEKVEVAIKSFHSVSSVKDFELEASVMQSLQNTYIVNLLGVCQGPPLMLVEEFVSLGSMLDYLEDYPQQVRIKQELTLWAAQIAKGMMYLETKRLVHRDLAARNILLKSLQHAKISDFGLSRAVGQDKDYYTASKGGRWPIKWYAPESFNYGHFSHASDVWSYGVTLWEMFTYGQPPYEDQTGVEVIKFIEDENRLPKPEKCPEVVHGVMLKCWSTKKEDRPTFTWLNQHFEREPEYESMRTIWEALGQRRAENENL